MDHQEVIKINKLIENIILNKVKRKKTWTSTEFTNIEDRKLRKGCISPLIQISCIDWYQSIVRDYRDFCGSIQILGK
jgi:hypothetical protein